MKIGKKVAVILGGVFLAGTMLIGGYLWSILSHIQYETKEIGTSVDSPPEEKTDGRSNESGEDLFGKEDRQNILLLGVDTRSEAENGRTDSMILLSVDKKSRTIRMVSLQRDLYLSIPDHGKNRLNAAYAFGGTSLLLETLRQNLDLEVDHYVKVDFNSFQKVVGALQGVDVELSKEEASVLNKEYGKGRFTQGANHLDEAEALSYCRIRKLDNDFGRGERQRKVLKAIVEKTKKASVFQIHQVLRISLEQVVTDMSPLQVLKTAVAIPEMASYSISEMSIPGEGLYQDSIIRKMMVLVPDMEKNKELLKDFLK